MNILDDWHEKPKVGVHGDAYIVASLVGDGLLLGIKVRVQDRVLKHGQRAGLYDEGHVGELDRAAAPDLDRLLQLRTELDESPDVVLVAVAEVRNRQRFSPKNRLINVHETYYF